MQADASETDELSQGDGKGGFGTNANIFDDGDWYQSVLRDLSEFYRCLASPVSQRAWY